MIERPKWMPDLQHEITSAHISLHSGDARPIFKLFLRTGLRAQIAVLEECREDLVRHGYPGQSILTMKIAALRKELGE